MKLVSSTVTQAIGHRVLQMKKQSPHIFFVGGIIGIGVSTVLACKSTLKLEETLDEIKEDLDAVKSRDKKVILDDGSEYEEQYYKDLAYVYGRSANKLGRLYGPSATIGIVSIAALTGSHVQLARRNTALAAALAAVSKAFDEYRIRVQDELGPERELDIYRALHEEEVEGADGKKEVVKVRDPNAFSLYAKIFDESNPNWQKNAEYNRLFIQCQQNYFNNRLHAYGHVFLNEVYDSLGFERTKAGQIVGWVLDGPNSDNHIDFGLFDARSGDFVNGNERSIWLDFNVDGPIYETF